MPEVTAAGIDSAKTAVELALRLAGQMVLWLGFMGVLRESGVLLSLVRALTPVTRRLFPEIPENHPALSAMVMNFSTNILGLGNAATPFGLKAMHELNTLNKYRGVATNSMVLFLVINTSGLALLPLGVVAIRASLGSKDAGGIILPSLIGTFIATIVAVALCKLIERLPLFSEKKRAAASADEVPAAAASSSSASTPTETKPPPALPELVLKDSQPVSWRTWFVLAIAVAIAWAFLRSWGNMEAGAGAIEQLRPYLSSWLLPLLMLSIVCLGFSRRIGVYEAFIASAKEGFHLAVSLVPYLVAILVAVGMFRASGALDFLIGAIGPWTSWVGLPAEALPMAFTRPLSGSGATAILMDTMQQHGPDSLIGYMVSLINGSSETTFYVLAVYFGAVHVTKTRHAVPACVGADILSLGIVVFLTHLFFGS
jgi:spore maturation protein SpmA